MPRAAALRPGRRGIKPHGELNRARVPLLWGFNAQGAPIPATPAAFPGGSALQRPGRPPLPRASTGHPPERDERLAVALVGVEPKRRAGVEVHGEAGSGAVEVDGVQSPSERLSTRASHTPIISRALPALGLVACDHEQASCPRSSPPRGIRFPRFRLATPTWGWNPHHSSLTHLVRTCVSPSAPACDKPTERARRSSFTSTD